MRSDMAPATASAAESVWPGLPKGLDLVSSSEQADAAFAVVCPVSELAINLHSIALQKLVTTIELIAIYMRLKEN